MSQDPFQLINSQKFNYGATPNQPVVEQNQTYFAYFDGVGGTGPEYIDGTAYFIKYLIDTEGNVVNPEPFTVADSPQAVPLYNLKDNFEPGKRATVKLIEPNPIYDTIPNSEILQGTHTIAHVGRIVPILVTETGENIQDYITTMSFATPFTVSPPSIFVIPNVNAQFQNSFNNTSTVNGIYTDLPYATTLTQYTNTNIWANSSPEYIINSSSIQTGTRIKIQAKIYVSSSFIATDPATDPDGLVYYTGAGGSFQLRILKNGDEIIEGPLVYYNKEDVLSPDGTIYVSAGVDDGYYTLTSNWIDYLANDEFKVQYKATNDYSAYPLKILGTGSGKYESRIRISQEYQPGVSGSSNNSPLQINGINVAFSGVGYFAALNVYNSFNGGTSGLICNEALSNIFQTNVIQNLSTTSSAMGFSPINIPFSDIKPGDFIRFEYNKEQTYTILRVTYNDVSERVELIISPSLSTISGFGTQTINLNHFVIYRVINDGVYVTLDVKKDAPGGAYSGILQPEFISKELVENYDRIITDLTSKEIIQ
jgi:hypothetical protein